VATVGDFVRALDRGLHRAEPLQVLESLKQEWRDFRDAAPGERFAAYHQRVKRASTGSRVARIGLGVLLMAAGVVMLFVPGPGILFMVFGLACFGGESRWIAQRLDKGELKARAGWRWLKTRWRATSTGARVAWISLGVAVVAALGVGAWSWLG